MCVTKKATKKPSPEQIKPTDAAAEKKKKGFNGLLKKKTPRKASAEGRRANTPSVAEMHTQLVEEHGRLEETPLVSGEKGDRSNMSKATVPTVAVEQKQTDAKRPNEKRPSCERGEAKSSTSGNRCGVKKKLNRFKWGPVDKDELSINNDKTEYLENAQLTKLMSHADVKALWGNQVAQGTEAGENSCRDTVEEVDSDMEDMVFSPLLAGIPKEEEKGYGILPNPAEQKEKKQETA